MRTNLTPLFVVLTLGIAVAGIEADLKAGPGISESPAQDQDAGNPRQIVDRSLETIRRDRDAAAEFDYFERDNARTGSRTFEVSMIAGSPYRKLVAIDESPLTPEAQMKEEQKEERAELKRCNESPSQTRERIAAYQKELSGEQQMMEQMTKAFTFRILGNQVMDGRQAWALEALPRPGYQPPTTETKALTGMQGRLWIDRETFQWIKVIGEVVHPVSIGGFLATVEPGTRFELEKGPVSPAVWMPIHYSMSASAEILSIFGHRSQEESSFFEYRKAAPHPCPAK